MQRFTIARGKSREIAGLADFRVWVASFDAAMGPDCQPAIAR